jgi:hypothetical protein
VLSGGRGYGKEGHECVGVSFLLFSVFFLSWEVWGKAAGRGVAASLPGGEGGYMGMVNGSGNFFFFKGNTKV